SEIWRQIDAVSHPGPAPEIAGNWPSASSAAKAAGRSSLIAKVAGLIASCTMMAIGAFGGLKTPAPVYLFLGSLPVYFLIRNSLTNASEVREVKSKYDATFAQWTREYSDWKHRTSPKAFDDKKAELRSLKERHSQLPAELNRRMDQLRRDQERIQR